MGWEDAFESDDSFATMSVRSRQKVSGEVETYEAERRTAGGVLFLVVVRHDDWLVCGMEVVIGYRVVCFLVLVV